MAVVEQAVAAVRDIGDVVKINEDDLFAVADKVEDDFAVFKGDVDIKGKRATAAFCDGDIIIVVVWVDVFALIIDDGIDKFIDVAVTLFIEEYIVDKGMGDFVDNGIPTVVEFMDDMGEMESGVVDIDGLECWLMDDIGSAGVVITSANSKFYK